MSHLHLFGVTCTSCILSNNLTKFAPCGGYAKDTKGFLVWIPGPNNRSGTVKARWDVTFHDLPNRSNPPLREQMKLQLWVDVPFPEHLIPSYVLVVPSLKLHKLKTIPVSFTVPVRLYISASPPKRLTLQMDQMYRLLHCMSCITLRQSFILLNCTFRNRPKRDHRVLTKYNKFVSSDSIPYPLLELDNEEMDNPVTETPQSFPSAFLAFLTENTIICEITDDTAVDPSTVTEAHHSTYWNEWLSAMHEELQSLNTKHTYEPVQSLPPGHRAVQSKWVLHIKCDKDNTISRFKARLVAKGFTQIPGQDFNYTFAPIARWDSICAVLSIATFNDYKLQQLDVKTAYLNGLLEEEIYMGAPPGVGAPYWRLRKGLYGLRQAGCQWYLTLHETYTSLNYTHCESDWSVYTGNIGDSITISATSVDDILLATNSKIASDIATNELHKKFTITDGGDAQWLLGCCISCWRSNCILKVDQESFLVCILWEFGMEFCNSTVTPCTKWRLTSDMCPKSNDK